MFPLSSWLPDSYPTAPAPVTAVFAGLLTKVGVGIPAPVLIGGPLLLGVVAYFVHRARSPRLRTATDSA